MRDVQLQPGSWFGTVRSQVLPVGEYHAQQLLVPRPRRRPRGDNAPLPSPPHLQWNWSVEWRSLTADQKGQLAQREQQWLKSLDAWLRRTKTKKAPSPPRRGSVIAWEPIADTRHYEVGRRAREALARLRQVAVVAGGVQRDRLFWVAQQYESVHRQDRASSYETARDHAAITNARSAWEQAGKELAAARATGNRAAIHEAESGRRLARTRLAPAYQESKQIAANDGAALAAFCLKAAEKEPVQRAAAAFVDRFGPLILDFGAWCFDTEYGAFPRLHPASALSTTSCLVQLGHERFLWPRGWRQWATKSYQHVMHIWPTRMVPPPVGFYVWAAYMHTALSEHPEWPGCQLFLANRLASLRLVSDEAWFPSLMESTKRRQGRRLSARLYGELLDYLALAAAYRSSSGRAKDQRMVICKNCRAAFLIDDGRRSLCGDCSNAKIRNAVAQREYRERQKNLPV